MNGLKRFWNTLRSSFWFIPSLIAGGSIDLAMGLINVHSTGSVHAEGARGMLSTIAGSMMTVGGGHVFDDPGGAGLAQIHLAHPVRNIMRDRITQVVLGIFSGIFAYCRIVLRTIRSGDEFGFVPRSHWRSLPNKRSSPDCRRLTPSCYGCRAHCKPSPV